MTLEEKFKNEKYTIIATVSSVLSLIFGLTLGAIIARPDSPHEAKVIADQMLAEENARHHAAVNGSKR